jgi:TonB-dependent SusC/RagA subfamily outer membrane receptor
MSPTGKTRQLRASAAVLGVAALAACSTAAQPDAQPSPDAGASVTAEADVLSRAQIDRIGASRMTDLFEGRFPGVQVQTARGAPRLLIRGAADPLIVIDDVPQADPQALWSLVPGDIEQIRILKEAGVARYGSRGARGVVLITTRER